MPSSEYHLKQAQIAASLALAETDREKVARLQLLALEHFEKAEKARLPSQPKKQPARVSHQSGHATAGNRA